MFSLKETPKWLYFQAFPTQTTLIPFTSAFASKLESQYLSLFNLHNHSYEKTLQYNDPTSSQIFNINLLTMKMTETFNQTEELSFKPVEYVIIRKGYSLCQMLGISIVICRNKAGKFLAVNEKDERGWYLPGGKVDPPECFQEAAIREAKEEANIDIILKGVLKHEYNFVEGRFLRYKVVFYAEPKDEKQFLKIKPDKESVEARWVSLEELKELAKKPPYLRATELLDWGNYLEKEGEIYPLDSFIENNSLFL